MVSVATQYWHNRYLDFFKKKVKLGIIPIHIKADNIERLIILLLTWTVTQVDGATVGFCSNQYFASGADEILLLDFDSIVAS